MESRHENGAAASAKFLVTASPPPCLDHPTDLSSKPSASTSTKQPNQSNCFILVTSNSPSICSQHSICCLAAGKRAFCYTASLFCPHVTLSFSLLSAVCSQACTCMSAVIFFWENTFVSVATIFFGFFYFFFSPAHDVVNELSGKMEFSLFLLLFLR